MKLAVETAGRGPRFWGVSHWPQPHAPDRVNRLLLEHPRS